MKTTTDLSKFGFRELDITANLLRAMCDTGLPKDFAHDGVHPMFNLNSGEVFLTNAEHQVCMLVNNKLESFYSCPICGAEGFREELIGHSTDQECIDYINEI